jgi:uncharacterized protein
MLVRFDQISPSGNHYEVRSIEGLASQQDFIVKGPLAAQYTLQRKGDDKVEMQGRLKACLSLNCDRCLASYDIEVDTELQVLFETASSDSRRLQEVECTISDLDSIVLDEPVVDLDDVLRQQLYLALPVKSLCSEQCKGICSGCGVNLNLAECGCEFERETSPFAVLARLKKKSPKK